MTAQHHDLGRWWTLSIAEQFGNVGSEVGRAIRWSVARLHEIARAREVVADFFAGRNHSTASSLQKYFDAYALVCRRR